MSSKRELRKSTNEDETIKDEEARRNLEILTARLYDLRERFMKIAQKVGISTTDAIIEQTSDEEDTDDDDDDEVEEEEEEEEKSDDQMSVDEDDSDSTSTSSDDSDHETDTHKFEARSKAQTLLIESILKRKASRYPHIEHIAHYPKIMSYLIDDEQTVTNIPLRHLEPFIKDYINKNPNAKIYGQINDQVQDIRRIYLEKYR